MKQKPLYPHGTRPSPLPVLGSRVASSPLDVVVEQAAQLPAARRHLAGFGSHRNDNIRRLRSRLANKREGWVKACRDWPENRQRRPSFPTKEDLWTGCRPPAARRRGQEGGRKLACPAPTHVETRRRKGAWPREIDKGAGPLDGDKGRGRGKGRGRSMLSRS